MGFCVFLGYLFSPTLGLSRLNFALILLIDLVASQDDGDVRLSFLDSKNFFMNILRSGERDRSSHSIHQQEALSFLHVRIAQGLVVLLFERTLVLLLWGIFRIH